MDENTLKAIFNQFEHNSKFSSYSELKSGHINDTYLVHTDSGRSFVLQRINHNVFHDVPNLVKNKILISKHLKSKCQNSYHANLDQRILSFVKVCDSKLYYYKENGSFWNLMVFINDSITYNIVEDNSVAFEAGKLLGNFLNLTADLDCSQLTEVLPNFHDMSFRFGQYDKALKFSSQFRFKMAEKYIDLVRVLKDEMHILQRLKESGRISIRVTHNDTKISNSLFDEDNKGICMIDTDTVMPGIVHYDFGDAIRTICNSALEDEKDLSKVEFNLELYESYKQGFLEQIKDSLSPLEIEYLPLAVKTMIFIMGLRFLTDYLNNDIYYKTKYPEHNLDRAKNQFKLIESFVEKLAL